MAKRYINIFYEKLVNKKKCLLVLDKVPSHCCDKNIKFMNENNIKRIFIPGGLKRKFQPLDIGINKPFKESIKKNLILIICKIVAQL